MQPQIESLAGGIDMCSVARQVILKKIEALKQEQAGYTPMALASGRGGGISEALVRAMARGWHWH